MRRTGVTLLEVLFAIGIVSVGILGVLSALVIAGKQATDGAVADGADRLGRNAIREFSVRAMDQANGLESTWATVPVDGRAYCLDPLFVAANGTASPASWFPAFDPVAVPGARMQRVSLREFPGDQLNSPLPPIGQAVSESVFVARDDLVFSVAADRTLPPVQNYGVGAESRGSNGRFSWFATVQTADYRRGNALLCIVVCHRRDVVDVSAERLVNVEALDANQYKLAARAGQPDTDLAVHDGEWVLLTGIDPAGQWQFGWHRVLNTKDAIQPGAADYDGTVSAVPTRWVSTFGRDWPLPAVSTQVAILGSVVAVYEKTIRFKGLQRAGE